ncbi:PhzF family phenazine biosynthesis protein [Fontivita pretiosa]|uniref:PhzF family phenazine biosynthesis protein n=1 Tax=Fontivita pretiosa TaxID=2989684 RepID=UPI003D168F43
MNRPIFQVDSFTDRAFTGNPAGVCLLDVPADEIWMQNVAAEMNLAETAFVHPGPDGYNLRWFSPTVEVDLCGHATLAAAHVLWETGQLAGHEPARFHTKSGLLTCIRRDDWIEMDFPATPAAPVDSPPPDLLPALGLAAGIPVARSRFDFLVELPSEQQVRAIKPDFARLARVSARGVIVTARSADPQFDFVSRFFAPQTGIDEDPVTGSSHCCLGPWWRHRLGKPQLLARQVSRRGGVIRVTVVNNDRTLLGGQAVTVLRGQIVA